MSQFIFDEYNNARKDLTVPFANDNMFLRAKDRNVKFPKGLSVGKITAGVVTSSDACQRAGLPFAPSESLVQLNGIRKPGINNIGLLWAVEDDLVQSNERPTPMKTNTELQMELDTYDDGVRKAQPVPRDPNWKQKEAYASWATNVQRANILGQNPDHKKEAEQIAADAMKKFLGMRLVSPSPKGIPKIFLPPIEEVKSPVDEYAYLIGQGLTPTQILKKLRGNKVSPPIKTPPAKEITNHVEILDNIFKVSKNPKDILKKLREIKGPISEFVLEIKEDNDIPDEIAVKVIEKQLSSALKVKPVITPPHIDEIVMHLGELDDIFNSVNEDSEKIKKLKKVKGPIGAFVKQIAKNNKIDDKVALTKLRELLKTPRIKKIRQKAI